MPRSFEEERTRLEKWLSNWDGKLDKGARKIDFPVEAISAKQASDIVCLIIERGIPGASLRFIRNTFTADELKAELEKVLGPEKLAMIEFKSSTAYRQIMVIGMDIFLDKPQSALTKRKASDLNSATAEENIKCSRSSTPLTDYSLSPINSKGSQSETGCDL